MGLLEKCKAEFELLTRVSYDENNPVHVSVVEDMIAYRTSQKGNEGLNSLSLGGVSETYKNDYPITIMRLINSLKKRVQIL